MLSRNSTQPFILVVKDDIETDAALTEIPASRNTAFLVIEDEARVLQFQRWVASVQARKTLGRAFAVS